MKTRAILISIAMFHWIFYGFWIIPVIINPEVWFFGEKFSEHIATAINLSIGISGFVLGWLVYKKKKPAYVGGVILFGIVLSGVLVNYSTSSSGHFIEHFSPDYPRSSDIPLYEGDSSPKEIPEYENDVGITPLNPNG